MTHDEIKAKRAELERELKDLKIAEAGILGQKVKLRSDFDQLGQKDRQAFLRAGGTLID